MSFLTDYAVLGASAPGVSTLLSGVQEGMMEQISSALPIAGVVFGAIAGISIGIKLFKRVTGARS